MANNPREQQEIEKLQKRVRDLEKERDQRIKEERQAKYKANPPKELTQAQVKRLMMILIPIIVVLVVFLVVLTDVIIPYSVAQPLKKEKALLNNCISKNGTEDTYTKVSGDYSYVFHKGDTYRFNYNLEYESSVSIKKGSDELYGIVCFDYGDYKNTAVYYGEIRIDGKICFLKFEGISCGATCPNISSPSEIKVIGYSKNWDLDDINLNDYRSDVWACVKAAVTLCHNTIHSWNNSLELWE